MDEPGVYNLGDLSPIAAPVSGLVITSGVSAAGVAQAFLDGLQGMFGATIQANFTYGSGGTSVTATVECSLDQGTTWIEVGRFVFTTASGEKVLNLLANSEIAAAYTPVPLSSDTGKSGIFGDRWRAKVTSVGTYSGNTTLAIRLAAR